MVCLLDTVIRLLFEAVVLVKNVSVSITSSTLLVVNGVVNVSVCSAASHLVFSSGETSLVIFTYRNLKTSITGSAFDE